MNLIDKDKVVAEINRVLNSYDPNEITSGRYALIHLRDFLDTLKVKEVDLEKEAELIANGIMIGVQANRYNTVIYNTKRNDFNHSHLMLAARKGIELGLKMHKNEI